MTDSILDPAQGRRCALVLGMHRSGTSAVTRVINLLGAALPRHLIPASGSNVAGHWEPKLIVGISNRLLAEGGSAWNDWRPFDPATALAPERFAAYRAEFQRAIEQDYPESPLFVLKDVRISRFAPYFIDLLAGLAIETRAIVMTRHPLEVVGSLRTRDRMPAIDALLLWLRHTLDAEAATRHVARLVLPYEELLQEPELAIGRLRSLLGTPAAEPCAHDSTAAGASLQTGLRHHVGAGFETPTFPEVGRWALATLAACAALARDPSDCSAHSALDSIRAEVDAEARRNSDRVAYWLRPERRAQRTEQQFADYRRAFIGRLATSKRAGFTTPNALPPALSPWRVLKPAKRARVRERRAAYLSLLASPLFDADFYVSVYPDVLASKMPPALHYLLHGSDEGRQPSFGVVPRDVLALFPDLEGRAGNLVLNLIERHRKPAKA